MVYNMGMHGAMSLFEVALARKWAFQIFSVKAVF
jgi:hypothetical protein